MGKHRKDLRTQVLAFVESFLDEQGYPPTNEEIREALGLSGKSHVKYYLDSLEEEGLILRKPRTPRGLKVLGRAQGTFEVPIEGQIAAGIPLDLGDALGDSFALTSDIADPRRELFALQVQGDSMVDDLVGDGDLIVVERRGEAARGQMAVVHLRDENAATLKRIYQEGERVRLQPAHPTLPSFYAHARDVAIQGRVVAVIRRF
jgi:repressor LexA